MCSLWDCIRVLCILELCVCFYSLKKKLLHCSWGVRGAFFQRITEEDKGGSQLNISLPTLLFFSCSRRRLSSRGNWEKRIPSFDWRHNSLYVVALTSTPKLFTEGPTGGSKEMALCVNAAAAAVTGLPPLQVGASKRPGSCNGAHGSSQISSFAVCNTGVLHLTATRTPLLRHSNNLRKIVCMQDLAEQIKEMKAAEKRWESQVKEGKVKSLSAKEAGYAIQLPNYTFLDVRPSSERSKAYVKDSIWIPMYEVDKSLDPGTLFKKLSNFTMGGWWSGLLLMKYNERFMPDVVAKIPKSYNLVVGCQKGLRSLAACEQLYKAGYRNLFWLNGGFDAAQEGDLERAGSQPLNFAGIGGVSEFLGWTDVQRAEAAKQGIGYRAVLFARLVGLLLAVDLFFLGAQQLTHYFQELRH